MSRQHQKIDYQLTIVWPFPMSWSKEMVVGSDWSDLCHGNVQKITAFSPLLGPFPWRDPKKLWMRSNVTRSHLHVKLSRKRKCRHQEISPRICGFPRILTFPGGKKHPAASKTCAEIDPSMTSSSTSMDASKLSESTSAPMMQPLTMFVFLNQKCDSRMH